MRWLSKLIVLLVLLLATLMPLSAQTPLTISETATPTLTPFPSTTPSPQPTDLSVTATPTALPLLTMGEIALGETVTDTFPDNVYEISYTLSGQVGENISITLSGASIYGGCLRLESPEVYVTSSSSNVYDTTTISFFTLPSTGSYQIIITQCGAISDYTLKVEWVSLQDIEYGELVEGTLTTAQPSAAYQFTGQKDDLIAISLISEQFDPLLALATLSASGASAITSDDNSGGHLNAFIGPYKLPQTGEYLIAMRASMVGVGEYRLIINHLEPETIQYGDQIEVSLTEEIPLQVFTFEGNEADVFDITVDSDNGLDTILTLSDPNGNTALSDDDSGGYFDPELTRQLVYLPGTHLILVRPYTIGETGQVQLTLSRHPSPSLDQAPQRITLNTKINFTTLTFTGQANQRVEITVRELETHPPQTIDTSMPSIHVAQNNQTLADASLQGGDTLVIEFIVPADGLVSIQVREAGSVGATYEVALERR